MRIVNVKEIKEAVANLCVEANLELGCDIKEAIKDGAEKEPSKIGQDVLKMLLENLDAARELCVPICQDTGMAVIFLEIGQDVFLEGGDLSSAINEGVKEGYLNGYLRCSVVSDPLERVNTDDNTPAVIHLEMVRGDKIKLTVAPKGFGSENMSQIKMFTPAATEEDIISFVKETVKTAGSNPCPPIILGVGIGGTFEKAALLSKKALLRKVDTSNENPKYKSLEEKMLDEINSLGIGPQGFGGKTTALKVNIETYPTHIAGLPVAVNFGCHVTRHKTVYI